MVPVIDAVQFSSADPAPVVHAPLARHMVAATFFVGNDPAVWALGNERVGRLPNVKCSRAFVLTSTGVPLTSTLKAHNCAAFAACLVGEHPWFRDRLAAVWAWAPLEVSVFSYPYVLPDCVKLVHHVFGAESLDVLGLEHLIALELHARKPHRISIIDFCLQVVSIAVNTESVPAR